MQAGPGQYQSQEQWLRHYALRDDLVCDAWLSAATQPAADEPQCRATWRALGYLSSADGKTPGPLDAEEFEASLAADLAEHGVPTSWEAFILQHNRLLQQRAAAFAADWVLEELIGEGGFAQVFRGSHRRGVGGGAPFALKVVLKEASPRKLAVLESESRVWRAVPPHHAIVALLGQYELPDRTVLVTELCQGGCLMDRLLEADHFSEEHARGLARQIASAVWHLHAVGVVHRDLKPDNLLCTHAQPHLHAYSGICLIYHVKLCDFGLASSFAVGEEADLTKLAGTPEYLAPEIVRILQRRLKVKGEAAQHGDKMSPCGRKMTRAGSFDPSLKTQHVAHYSERVDLWALGCVIYELLSGEPPFLSEDDDELYSLILTREPAFPQETFGLVSEQAKDLLRALLHRDPQQRLAGDALMASAWWQFQGPTDTPLADRQSVAKERTFATRGAITGHLDQFHRPVPGRIRKVTSMREVRVYSALKSSGLAPFLAPLGPETSRTSPRRTTPRSNSGLEEKFERQGSATLDMFDLTFDKEVACCMDLKMGTRTFTEREAEDQQDLMCEAWCEIKAHHSLVTRTEAEAEAEAKAEAEADPGPAGMTLPPHRPEGVGLLRADLLDKMVRVDPDAPTTLERRLGGVSKFRYMRFREEASTSAKLGFRVDGVRLADEVEGTVPTTQALKQAADEEAVVNVLRAYCQGRGRLLRSFARQCRQLREAFEADDVAAHHAFIRSSLLLVYSDVTNETSVHMIDFARSYRTEQRLSHRVVWQPGNHEDGFLTGLDNLVRILDEAVGEDNREDADSPWRSALKKRILPEVLRDF